MLLGIAGMVGSGKTTLARALASRFGLQLALESVDQENPWLEPFYSSAENMRTYALHLSCIFSQRVRQRLEKELPQTELWPAAPAPTFRMTSPV